jgi:hypothetical protein
VSTNAAARISHVKAVACFLSPILLDVLLQRQQIIDDFLSPAFASGRRIARCTARQKSVDSGFYAACAGLKAQSQALEVAANNLSNLNTTGYGALSPD